MSEKREIKVVVVPGVVKFAGFNQSDGKNSIKIELTPDAKQKFLEEVSGFYNGNAGIVKKDDVMHLNLSSQFDIPVKGEVDSLHNIGRDASVLCSVNVSSTSIYPKAVKVLTQGTLYDPFAELD